MDTKTVDAWTKWWFSLSPEEKLKRMIEAKDFQQEVARRKEFPFGIPMDKTEETNADVSSINDPRR